MAVTKSPLVWSVLIHSLPPKPAYLRAKVRNRLRKVGAVALKDSVYVLPADPTSREELRSVAAEAVSGGGEAYLCEARFDDAGTDALLSRQFPRDGGEPMSGRTWTTRRGIQIDRIASAWLIRRFIDSRARFRFVDAREPRPPGELTFDMPGGDFTHEEDRCTFETLVFRLRVQDPAVGEIAEIVHDIDIKDGKFQRPEAVGLERVLHGLLLANADDETRLKRGSVLFDELYGTFRPQGGAGRKSR